MRVDLTGSEQLAASELGYFASSAQLAGDDRLLIQDISRAVVVLFDLAVTPPRRIRNFDVAALGKLSAMAFSVDGGLLAVGSINGHVSIYQVSREGGSVEQARRFD